MGGPFAPLTQSDTLGWKKFCGFFFEKGLIGFNPALKKKGFFFKKKNFCGVPPKKFEGFGGVFFLTAFKFFFFEKGAPPFLMKKNFGGGKILLKFWKPQKF